MDSVLCIAGHPVENTGRQSLQFHQPLGQVIGIVGPEGEPGHAVTHQRCNAAAVRHHRHQTRGHRLQHHQPERFHRAKVQ
jgi:hypothetical protein